MFITTVFVLFLIKLRWSKNKSLYGTKKLVCGEVVVSNGWVVTCYHENSQYGFSFENDLNLTYCLCNFFFQCPFFEFENFKVIYKRYASLFFVVGVDSEEASVLSQVIMLSQCKVIF